jgi:hypothetical protein
VFSKPTVLIIGAGASAEFNMPLGSRLVKRVADAVVEPAAVEPEKNSLLAQMRACLGIEDADRLYSLGPELAAFASKSKLPSMDEVLHFLSDQDLVKLGKLAIAHEILKAECESHLFLAMSLRVPEFIEKCNESWASEFLGLALSNSQEPNLLKLFANVTVIDFNYDRVLPQYLYWALHHNLTIQKNAAAECVKNLKILHPYGSVGKLEWEANKEVLPFGSRTGNLADIASRIRTYTDEREAPERVQIQNGIDAAGVIIVVGFGYHKQNIQILLGPGGYKQKQMFMTLYGINDEINHQAIKRAMLNTLHSQDIEPAVVRYNGQTMFRELRPALSLAVS